MGKQKCFPISRFWEKGDGRGREMVGREGEGDGRERERKNPILCLICAFFAL
jgi:hypothetical protein